MLDELRELPVTFLKTAALLVVAACAAWADSATPACQTVVVQDSSTPPQGGGNAVSIAQKLNSATSEVSVRALSDNLLLICADSATAEELKKAVRLLSSVDRATIDTLPTRLYFNRNAPDIAKLLTAMYPDNQIQPLGNDMIVFQSRDDATTDDIKRWIALIDAPRPEIAANVWSVQISSHDKEAVDRAADQIRSIVSRYNDGLQRSLERGWAYLGGPEFAATVSNHFTLYVASHYTEGQNETGAYTCTGEHYCLGYADSFFEFLQPKLTSMIGLLSAANTAYVAAPFVDAMEDVDPRKGGGSGQAGGGDCESTDATLDQNADGKPAFACFRRQLAESLQPKHKGLLRKAIADFLFQYKASVEYRHAFEAYDYVSSAQDLDTQLDPILVAFNRDVAVYLSTLQQEVRDLQAKDKKIAFASNGTVTIRTISGTDSEVDTATQNKFATTPPPLVQDFVKQFTAAQGNEPMLFKSNLPGNAATALAAFLNSGQSSSVVMGRDLTLKLTPISLQGGGAAELKVHLETKDDGKPQTVAPDGTAKDDSTDRVSQHTVDTNVRVDSLKLFEVSSFSAALSRGRDPIGLIPPFVELPYIGSFLKLSRSPSTVYHRSVAVISAVVVPTAADLLDAMRYQRDRAKGDQRLRQMPDGALRFHRAMLHCIAQEAGGQTGTGDSCRLVDSPAAGNPVASR